MTESDILRIWNGPTSQCNKAKILQFAVDLEAKRTERPANEKDDEQALRIRQELRYNHIPENQFLDIARRLRAESQEYVSVPRGSLKLAIEFLQFAQDVPTQEQRATELSAELYGLLAASEPKT